MQVGVEGQRLTEEDQLFIPIQAALNITAMRESAPEANICYERTESLCHSLNRSLPLYVALMGQLRYSVVAGKLTAAMPLAKRLYSLAQKRNDPTLMIGACTAVGGAHYYLGDFENGAAIHNACSSGLALGRRRVSVSRGRRATRRLSGQ